MQKAGVPRPSWPRFRYRTDRTWDDQMGYLCAQAYWGVGWVSHRRIAMKMKLKSLFVLVVALLGSIAQRSEAVTLGWDASPDPTVTGYKLYYGAGTRNYTNSINTGTATTGVVSGLVSGVTYYFAATAYAASGAESDYSAEVSYTAPAAPNTPPTISALANQTINKNLSTPAIP